jgi:Spy/CpxP family protein refolding chaperone
MTRRAYLYFILTFVLGVIVGGAGVFYFAWSSGHWGPRHFDRQRLVRRLTRDLNLTNTQVQQLNQIMDDTSKKLEELRGQMDSQFDAARKESQDRVRQILTPEQLAKFNEMVRRFEERRQRRGPPPH